MDSIMSLDRHVSWTLNDAGQLEETGADSAGMVRRDAIDTEILLVFLKRHEDFIHRQADKERTRLFGKEFKQMNAS